jgi:hypothetical protein
MERVPADRRLGSVAFGGDGAGVAGGHVHRHRLDTGGALFAELVEEAVQGGGITALGAPDDLAAAVIGHQGQVLVAFAPAHLVHPDLEQRLESLGVQPVVHDPLDDAPHGVPVDAHQPTDRGLVHGGGQPPHQVLEVGGEARAGTRARAQPPGAPRALGRQDGEAPL